MENMENFEMDKLLCNLAFEEYVSRKKILELMIKGQNLNDSKVSDKITELRERANHLNNLILQYSHGQNDEKTR